MKKRTNYNKHVSSKRGGKVTIKKKGRFNKLRISDLAKKINIKELIFEAVEENGATLEIKESKDFYKTGELRNYTLRYKIYKIQEKNDALSATLRGSEIESNTNISDAINGALNRFLKFGILGVLLASSISGLALMTAFGLVVVKFM